MPLIQSPWPLPAQSNTLSRIARFELTVFALQQTITSSLHAATIVVDGDRGHGRNGLNDSVDAFASICSIKAATQNQ